MNWTWSGEAGMDLHEALRVACNLIKVTSYLEIGVDGGGSLNTVLCEVVPPRIVLCDIWDPKYCDHGDAKPHVLNILKHFKAQAEFLDGDSKLRIPTLLDKFDLVLVDGDHSEEGARTDLYNAWPLVRPGGILVMDDINHPNYPWLEQVWQSALQRWGWVGAERIEELHGGCNAAMVMKTT